MAEDRKKPSWEEIVERKMNMARERGSRVLKINSPLGSALFNVLQQFDQAYARFKGQLGEAGGVSHEEGAELMEEAQQITMALSDLTARLSKKIRFRYYVPQELKEMKAIASTRVEK